MTLPGWKTKTTDIKHYKDLPENARKYIEKVERLCEFHVRWIGVGQGRENIISKPLS